MIGRVIGALTTAAAAGVANSVKKNTGTNTVKKNTETKYDPNIDYQALINEAQRSGNMQLARQYEAQRNAKINDMNNQGTNTNAYQYTNYYQPINLPEYKPYSGDLPTLNLPEYKPYSGDLPTFNMPEYTPFSYQDFNYDVNNDNIYKQYAEQFARQGQSAGEKALANTAAATGGMPSSYAAAANAQAQQAYAKKTADMIPVLEQNAYGRYSNERNFSYQDHLNQYDASVDKAKSTYDADWRSTDFDYQDYLNEYNSNSQRAQAMYDADWRNVNFNYQDNLNQYNAGVDRAKSIYDSEMGLRDFNYQNYLNNLDNTYRRDTFDWNKETDSRNYNRDVLESDRNYNYNAGQDAIRNSISWANHNLSKQKYEDDKENQNKDNGYTIYQARYDEMMSEEEAKMKAAAEAETEGNMRLWLADVSKARNPRQWLNENVQFMTEAEYKRVVQHMKDMGYI